jgi:Grx4 family monothiol glutaredoxin
MTNNQVTSSDSDNAEKLNERLRTLVNSATVMLFMKGSPESPRCGFSRKIVELLRNNQISFASFDILTDEDVRSGLKVLYNWPTYPQLYVRGNLVGGLDIVTEMAADTTSTLRSQLELKETDAVPFVEETIDDRLKKLINRSKVILFMKGSPSVPKCGFSRTTCQILKDENIEFDSFDILEDEEVRPELKRYSNWPTYPQLYVNGTLIGGLDIIKDMQSEGPLKEQLLVS